MKTKKRKRTVICILLIFLLFSVINTVQANVIYGTVLFNDKPLEGAIVDIGCDDEPARTNQDGMYTIETFNCKKPLNSPIILKACVNNTKCPETTERIDNIPDQGIKKDFKIKSCIPNYHIRFYLTALKEEAIMTESEYQNPLRFKEDDYIRLEKFEVTNTKGTNGDYCKILGMGFNIDLIKPNGQIIDLVFGSGGSFYIGSSLGEGDIYVFKRVEQTQEINEGTTFIRNKYIATLNDIKVGTFGFRGTNQLLDVGTWTIIGELRDAEGFPYPKEKPEQVDIQIITNKNEIREPSFKVKPVLDISILSSIEDLKESTDKLTPLTWWLVILTILLGIISIWGIYSQRKLAKDTEETLKNMGTNQITTFEKVGGKQIKELKAVSESIKDSAEKRLKDAITFENEKRKNIIKALLKELNGNHIFIKQILKDKEIYVKTGLHPMGDFILDTINLVLSRYTLQDEKINENLDDIRYILSLCNNFLENCRTPGISKEKCIENMGKFIKNLEKISPTLINSTIKDIKKYMEKI